ncbi:MAG: methyltransferase domain-containing protein [Beutenbergiaceae bacterium]
MDQEAHGIPQSNRPIESVQGHWLLARLGKRVLRPGGLELTTSMLRQADPRGADVVEFAPGIGRTAAMVMDTAPASYVGVDNDADAVRLVTEVVAPRGRCIQADAHATGLDPESADLVIGEAMLTMQGDRAKREIIAEAARLLRPGGRYAIHELGLMPDDAPASVKDEIKRDLAQAIRVNARPLTVPEWSQLLEQAGLEVEWTQTAPMALLQLRRNLADEGLVGTLRIIGRALFNSKARARVLHMQATFRRHADHLCGVALVARRPLTSGDGHIAEPPAI